MTQGSTRCSTRSDNGNKKRPTDYAAKNDDLEVKSEEGVDILICKYCCTGINLTSMSSDRMVSSDFSVQASQEDQV